MSGTGTEFDNPDPGQPITAGYPATVTGTVTIVPVPAGLSIMGTESFFESPTAP